MKFSVIIPYFNALTTIERTLESIFCQNYSKYEVIIVNDLSPDDPREIIEKFTKKFKQIGVDLKYVVQSCNSGPSIARNIGWELASGDYIAFLDADDFWHPNKLEICAHFIAFEEPIMIYHNAEVTKKIIPSFDEMETHTRDEYRTKHDNKFRWLMKNHSVTPSVVLKKDIKFRFNAKMKYSEDYELWLKIIYEYNSTIRLDGPTLTFLGKPFKEGNSLSSNITKMRIGEMQLYSMFCLQNPQYLVLLPILFIYSIMKHIRLLIK